MGGKKKPTVSQLEKRLRRMSKKGGKTARETRKPTMTLATSGALTSISLDNLYNELKKMKVITPYQVSTTFKIKIGVAKEALRRLESQGLLKLVDKNRRVSIYVPVKQ